MLTESRLEEHDARAWRIQRDFQAPTLTNELSLEGEGLGFKLDLRYTRHRKKLKLPAVVNDHEGCFEWFLDYITLVRLELDRTGWNDGELANYRATG